MSLTLASALVRPSFDELRIVYSECIRRWVITPNRTWLLLPAPPADRCRPICLISFRSRTLTHPVNRGEDYFGHPLFHFDSDPLSFLRPTIRQLKMPTGSRPKSATNDASSKLLTPLVKVSQSVSSNSRAGCADIDDLDVPEEYATIRDQWVWSVPFPTLRRRGVPDKLYYHLIY